MNQLVQLLSNLRTATLFAVCSFILFAGTAFTQDNPARLGGPAKQSLRDQYSPADYENMLRKQRNGEIPQQGGPVGTSGTSDVLVNNNSGAGGTNSFTQSETCILAFGSNVVVGFNDAGSYPINNNHFTGFSYSTDGGATFTDGGALPASGGGDAGDPVMARDETTGRIYFSTLGFAVSTIQMWRSDDNGVTWMAPVNATPGGSSEDKQWHVVDNFAGAGNGNVYLITRNFGGGNGIYMHRSTDFGATFSTGVLIATGSPINVQGAFVAVGPDHSVDAFYFDENSLPERIFMRRSTDQGLTFGAPVVIATLGTATGFNGDLGLTGIRAGLATPSAFRSNSFPHAAVNPVSGNIYVTYNDNPAGTDKADVFFVQSTDGGATWSAPVKVNDDATTTDQWQPTIAVTPDGASLGVFYYSRQEDVAGNNLFKYYGRIGTISGSTVSFASSFPVSDVASLPEFGRDSFIQPLYMGDYNHASATPGFFHVVWSDNRDTLADGAPRKDPNVYYKKVVAGLLSVSDAPVVNSPIASGSTSVSGTSTEADGTVIDVFVNSSSVGTTTVTGGLWTKGGLLAAKSGPSVGLAAGDTVKATATASGETVSPFSNEVIVQDVTTAPVVNSPIPAGSTIVIGTSTEANGTVINVFVNSLLVGSSTVTGGTWLWDQSDLLGNRKSRVGLVAGDTVKATATAVDKLASTFSNEVIVQDVTTAPVVTSPIAAGATSVSGTGPEASITTAANRMKGDPDPVGTTIEVFKNSISVGTTFVNVGGSWTKSGLGALAAGDSVKATATTTDKLKSPFSNIVIVQDVTTAPVVTSPITAGATSVSGTGPETIITKGGGPKDPLAGGTIIEVFKNSVSVGTTGVNAGGSWTKSGLAALAAGDTVKAKATAFFKLPSPFSNEVIVDAPTPVTSAPTVNSPIASGSTSVNGTSSEADGTVIDVFVNGSSAGTTTVGSGAWTKSGLAALVAGDSVKATATASGKTVSPFSNVVGVQDVSDAPTVDSPILAGATSVSGTSTEAVSASMVNRKSVEAPPPATVIEVFVNGSSVGTTTVSGGLWTKSGLAPLVAGALVKAKATASGELPSGYSNVVTVSAPPASNVIVNPGFESGTSPWVFYTNGTGNLAIVAPGPSSPNAARVTITTTGSNMQLYQAGITIQPATQYRLTFKALSSVGHNLSVFIARHDAPYTNYGLNGQIFDLTAAWQTFTVDFTTVGFPPPTPSNARLRFAFNGYASPGDLYFIDDVTLEVLGSPLTATKVRVETAPDGGGSVVPAQTIQNGNTITMYAISRTATDQFVANVSAVWSYSSFSGGVLPGDLVPSVDGKSAVFTGGADGTANVQATSGALTPVPSNLITVFTPPPVTNLLLNGGFESGTTNWTFQTNGAGTFAAITPGTVGAKAGQISITTQGTTVQLYQQNITLTSGNNYRLSFKAKSTTGHDVQASIFKHGSPFTPYGLTNQFFNLTNAWADYSVDFLASGFAGTATDARLRLWLSPYDAAGDVYQFDDVKIELLPAPSASAISNTQSELHNPQSAIPTEFTLAQNFPNPFNPSTNIIYTLPVDARVTLEVYDLLGQRVAQLVDGVVAAGYHNETFDASTLASGLYLYRLTAVGTDGMLFTKTEKMLLTK